MIRINIIHYKMFNRIINNHLLFRTNIVLYYDNLYNLTIAFVKKHF